MQIQFQVSISNKLPHQLSFQSIAWELVPGLLAFLSFSHRLAAVVRSPTGLSDDGHEHCIIFVVAFFKV